MYVFDGQGQLVGPVDSARWQLSDAEWKSRLTPEQYKVSRGKGTERAFCGLLLHNHEEGVYACIGCRLPLFSSASKYNSGTGWPSFFQPIAPGNVREEALFGGRALGSEILCARCGGHLGHVFNDGPEPTGNRFCLNSEALEFTPADKLASLADDAAGAAASSPDHEADSANKHDGRPTAPNQEQEGGRDSRPPLQQDRRWCTNEVTVCKIWPT